jgi:HK97 gp10 family phage protein
VPKETVTIVGLEKLERALAEKAAELAVSAAAAVAAEVNAIEDDARNNAPHLTGELQEGIESEHEGTAGTIRSTSAHSLFMEHGTYKDRAQPFMKPAAERARRRFPKRAAEIIRAALGG